MRVLLKVFGKNKETDEPEVFELSLPVDDVACLYRDRYGVAVTTHQGKFYRLDHSLEELKDIIYG